MGGLWAESRAGPSYALGTGLGFGFYPKCDGKSLEDFKRDANMTHTHFEKLPLSVCEEWIVGTVVQVEMREAWTGTY